ncbi:hypothetical protein RQN30_10400 [Arcanobacterium hippocoleae]
MKILQNQYKQPNEKYPGIFDNSYDSREVIRIHIFAPDKNTPYNRQRNISQIHSENSENLRRTADAKFLRRRRRIFASGTAC